MNTEQSKKVVLKLIESMNNRDLKGSLDLLAEDLAWWVIGSIPGVSGTRNKEEMAKQFQWLFGTISGSPWIVDHIIGEGDWVAAEVSINGKTPKGHPYQQKYHFKYEVKGGKIRTVRAYNDTALIKEVLAEAQR